MREKKGAQKKNKLKTIFFYCNKLNYQLLHEIKRNPRGKVQELTGRKIIELISNNYKLNLLEKKK